MNAPLKTITKESDFVEVINCWASYPWEELHPKGKITGIYFSRDLGSYIYIELFSAEELLYADVLNTVISYYDELVLNRNWTLD